MSAASAIITPAAGPGVLCQWCEDFCGLEVRASGQHAGVGLCEYCLRGEWNPARGTEGSKLCGIPGCPARLAKDSREKYCFKDRRAQVLATAAKPLHVGVPAGQRRVRKVAKPKAEPKHCLVCEKALRSTNTSGLCYDHRAVAEVKHCSVCRKRLNAANESGYCYEHRVKPSVPRLCGCGCGGILISRHKFLAGHGPADGRPRKEYLDVKKDAAENVATRSARTPRVATVRDAGSGGGRRGSASVAAVPDCRRDGSTSRTTTLRPASEPKFNQGERNMADRLCKCGCGERAGLRWDYKRGHKPKGAAAKPAKKLLKQSDGGGKRRATA